MSLKRWLRKHRKHGEVEPRHGVPALHGFTDVHPRDYLCTACGKTKERP